MSRWNPKANEIFLEVQDCETPERRQAFLDEACGSDGELRDQVESLLEADLAAPSILDRHAAELAIGREATVCVGTQIGPYKIRELIGEGGMGEVYVAEQVEPVRRKVALKIIRPGMATKDVITRFEAERQALAMMDHPNIAKVFDAGTTAKVRQPFQADDGAGGYDGIYRDACQPGKADVRFGPPFFVMELVQGPPITDYCDDRMLSTRERLELFLSVCRAVQHAHQKGIIHRDLKPSNVLVPEIDGSPVPKVIDFGVAKAIDQKLTEKTVYTQFSQMIGTPTYMSPEQAGLGVVDVDTRSDIYSLGVLLYELLTGTTPFDSQTLRRVSFEEMQRIIREEEPPPPSKRLTQRTKCNDTHTTQSASRPPQSGSPRHSAFRTPHSAFDQDLDWIVLKCLEKDRTRRYETAADLARDIERHLADEPVNARPPSRAYRVRKFVRKHRMGVLAVAAVMIALTVGIIATSLALARAVAARDVAQENLNRSCELIEKALEPTYRDLSAAADPDRIQQRNRIIDHTIRFYTSLGAEAQQQPRVRFGIAKAYAHLAYYELLDGKDGFVPAKRAVELLESLVAQDPHNRDYVDRLADLYGDMGISNWILGQRKRFAVECGKGVALLRTAVAQGYAYDRFVLIAGLYGDSLRECGRFHEAEEQFTAALAVAQSLYGSSSSEPTLTEKFHELTAHVRYADLLIDTGRYEEAAMQLKAAVRLAEEGVASQTIESERLLNKFWWAIAESTLGDLKIIHNEPDAALVHLQRASDLLDGSRGFSNYKRGFTHYRRGLALTQLGRLEEAISAHEEAERCWRSSGTRLALDYVPQSKAQIGELYYALGRPEPGDEHLAAALSEFKASVSALPDEPIVDPLVVFLCTFPNPGLRDPAAAVRLAERFKNDCESSGPFWRYLGLARYRAGDWAGAEEAIRKSIAFRNGGDALDWLLLAASQQQAGHRDEAKGSFAQARELIENGAPIFYGNVGVLGYQRLRAEIEALMRD